MSRSIILLGSLLVVVGLSWAVFEKEVQLRNGARVYLELAPVDPRSLMQGDYMRLRYALEDRLNSVLKSADGADAVAKTGRLVLSVNEQGVAEFSRIDVGARPLAKGEVLLKFKHRQSLQLGAGSFFFQEGTGNVFAQAKYGELSVDAEGVPVLIGLRDEKLNVLGPDQRLHQ